jgi:nucleoside-diphosphate-sugar epimerase
VFSLRERRVRSASDSSHSCSTAVTRWWAVHARRRRRRTCATWEPNRSCWTCSTSRRCTRRFAANRPDAVVNEATALSGSIDYRHFDRGFAQTNRLRTAGTDTLLAAARAVGARRFVAQSFTSWPYAREGGPIKTEEDPLDPDPPSEIRETLAAIRYLERTTVGADGIALRYGGFYGSPDDAQIEAVRKRRFPIVGSGDGITSFVHLEDAAAATVLAVESDKSGLYNVVDDEPAPAREWLPVLASVIGAKPPRHVPAWLARRLAGDVVVWSQ